MPKSLLLSVFLIFTMFGFCFAGDFNAGLTVSDTTVFGTVSYKEQRMNGYWRLGGTGVYSDQSSKEYKWLEVDFMFGNDLLHPGLIVEAGAKGVMGDAESGFYSGDIGALAFSARIGYLFPTTLTFIPIQVYGDVSYAPQILAFRDNDNYFSYGVGADFEVIDNAFIVAGYRVYEVEMDSGPGEWELSDDQFYFGLRVGF